MLVVNSNENGKQEIFRVNLSVVNQKLNRPPILCAVSK